MPSVAAKLWSACSWTNNDFTFIFIKFLTFLIFVCRHLSTFCKLPLWKSFWNCISPEEKKKKRWAAVVNSSVVCGGVSGLFASSTSL